MNQTLKAGIAASANKVKNNKNKALIKFCLQVHQYSKQHIE